MNITSMQEEISRALSTQIEIEDRGIDSYRVNTPFTLGDGDELKIILKRAGDTWRLTDEGHTLMYLSYHEIGVDNATRAAIIEKVLKSHFMKDEDGRFVLDNIKTEREIIDAVFTFSQGLLKIGDMSMWKVERAKSNYAEAFRSIVTAGVKKREVRFSYYNKDADPGELYPIDCCVRMNTGRHAYIFSAVSAEKANAAVAAIYYFEKKNIYVPSCVILQNKLSEKFKLRLEEAADKVFSTPQSAEARLDTYLQKYEEAA